MGGSRITGRLTFPEGTIIVAKAFGEKRNFNPTPFGKTDRSEIDSTIALPNGGKLRLTFKVKDLEPVTDLSDPSLSGTRTTMKVRREKDGTYTYFSLQSYKLESPLKHKGKDITHIIKRVKTSRLQSYAGDFMDYAGDVKAFFSSTPSEPSKSRRDSTPDGYRSSGKRGKDSRAQGKHRQRSKSQRKGRQRSKTQGKRRQDGRAQGSPRRRKRAEGEESHSE